MKFILFLLMAASLNSYAGSLTLYTHSNFSPLSVDFGPFGNKELQGGFLHINGPEEIIKGDDKVTEEQKLKDSFFKSLIRETENSSYELRNLVTRSLKNDFINHQRAVELYVNGLNSCLRKVRQHNDKNFLSQYRCKGKDSDALHEALKKMKNIAKNSNSSYMDYYESGPFDNLSDSRFEIPGVGSVRYYESSDTYVLENHIFSNKYAFKLNRIKCDSKECLLVVRDDERENRFDRDSYDLNHPANRLKSNI